MLNSSQAKIRTYTREEIKVLGRITLQVSYKGKDKELPLLVVEGDGPPLISSHWLQHI